MMNDKTRSQWVHQKTQAEANGGMVAARHPLAAEAGVEILKAGGNAADAVVAASFAESVVQPVASTIGGGGMICYGGPNSKPQTINYLYEAPQGARADMFPLESGAGPGLFGWTGVKDSLNEIGALAAAVPGSVAGLTEAVAKFGRLPLNDVMKPAIRLADAGFEMDWYGSLMAGIHLDILRRYKHTAATLLREKQYPYRPRMLGTGDIHRQPELAATLRAISRGGAKEFYQGEVANSIERAVREEGGVLRADDLASYKTISGPAREIEYRGYQIYGQPHAMMLYALFINVLSEFDWSGLSPDDPRRLHLLIEISRRCWHDRYRYNGDARFFKGPWEALASREYAALVADTIDKKKRTSLDRHPDPTALTPTVGKGKVSPIKVGDGRTVHISAIDSSGGMASLTETVLGNYGCYVTSDTGVLLNNGMMAFTPMPGHPGSIEPGKRPATNMGPMLVFDPKGQPFMTLGASGGRKIVSAVLQILNLVIDHKFDIQAAVAYPRVEWEGDKVILDARFSHTVINDLISMGHDVETRAEDLSTFEFGNACGITRDASGLLKGGVNPYQATAAVGFNL